MKDHSAHFITSSSERIQKETMLSGTVLQNEKNKSTRSGISLRAKIFIRFIIISILGYVTVAFFDSPYWLTGIWTLVIAIALLNNTLKLVDQADRKLVTFLQSLRQNDFSITFTDDKRSSHYDLHDAFNQLNEKFRSLRSEKRVPASIAPDNRAGCRRAFDLLR